MRPSTSLLLAVAGAELAPAQTLWIVDAAGGPGPIDDTGGSGADHAGHGLDEAPGSLERHALRGQKGADAALVAERQQAPPQDKAIETGEHARDLVDVTGHETAHGVGASL